MSQGPVPENAGALALEVRKLLKERRASLSASDAELLHTVLAFLEDAQHSSPPLSRAELIALGGEVVRIMLCVFLGT